MGLFDFFKKKNLRKQNVKAATSSNAQNSPNPGQTQKVNEPYLGDISKTLVLQKLFSVQEDLRNEAWLEQFYQAVAEASFKCEAPQVIQGPDGFPYVKLEIPAHGEEFQCYVLKHMKDDFLLERGFGVAIFAGKNQPDWVFSYGDILNFHLLNSFTAKNDIFSTKHHDEDLPEPEDILMGGPAKEILPMEARKVLCAFLSHYYDDPKVGLIAHKSDNTYELAFDCTPDKFEDHETFREIIQQISWFLPRYYAYCALEEQENSKGFISLCPTSPQDLDS